MEKVGRFPLVTRDEILVAYRPGSSPTEGAFRTLRERKVVSAGLGLPVRRGNRLSGQLRVYSTLNLDAAVLERHGNSDDARKLADRATRQETKWEKRIQELVSQLDITELQHIRKLRNQLVHHLLPLAQDVESARRSVGVLKTWIHEELGVVADLSDQWASIQILPDLEETVEVQRFLAHAASVAVGDIALLRLERFGNSSLVEILPAVADAQEYESLGVEGGHDAEISSYAARILEPVPFEEEFSTQIKQLKEAGEFVQIPKRRIRLAG